MACVAAELTGDRCRMREIGVEEWGVVGLLQVYNDTQHARVLLHIRRAYRDTHPPHPVSTVTRQYSSIAARVHRVAIRALMDNGQ